MTNRRLNVVGLILAAGLLGAGSASAEVYDVYPHQEASVVIDSDGFPVDFQPSPAVGDSTDGRYVRALFTFDLSFLPPGAVVTSAVVHTDVGGLYGDPVSLGPLMAARVAETRGSPSVDIQTRWGTLPPFIATVQTSGTIARGSELTADLTTQFATSFPSPDWSLDPGRAVVRFEFTELNNGSDRDDFFYFQRTRLELDVDFPDPIAERPIGRHLKRCIPVVASLPGAAGTQWATELHITARHDSTVWLYFTESDTDGTTAFRVRRVNLGMWQSVRYGNVLPNLFALDNTKGWIEVFTTDPDITINARVANVGAEGSYGQTVPLVGESQMLRISEIRFWDDYRRLANLVMMDADNRTNVGFVNLGPNEVTVKIIAISPDGPFLGDATVDLDPFEHRQIDRLETVIPDAAGVGLVSLALGVHDDETPVYRQGVAAYVSRVDNATGDAVFVLP